MEVVYVAVYDFIYNGRIVQNIIGVFSSVEKAMKYSESEVSGEFIWSDSVYPSCAKASVLKDDFGCIGRRVRIDMYDMNIGLVTE